MSFRLSNQNDPNVNLRISNQAWFGILELAEAHGWNPMGTILPGWWYEVQAILAGYSPDDMDVWEGSYTGRAGRLVMLEDALNLADALERAFLEYEPEFTHMIPEAPPAGMVVALDQSRPSIGALAAVADLCRSGAFWIEID